MAASALDNSVAIIGGGPVGMSLALALHQRGIASQIHDTRTRGSAMTDKRVLALSQGSKQTLAQLGVWDDIQATAITHIHVSQRGGAGRTQIRASEEGVAALGYVAPMSSIATALDKALASVNIPYIENSTFISAETDSETIRLTCSDGEYQAKLTAYAEGRIDENGNSKIIERDYAQHALICHLTPAEPHQGRAWERFTPHGPFALLPNEDGYAAVYTCTPAQAEALTALTDTDLLAHLQNEFGTRVQFTAIRNRFIYPLGLRYRETAVAERQVWLGNAAQTLHPVAGQGFNLALRDCMSLAHTLRTATDPGAASTLARYTQARKIDRRSVIGVTDGMVRLFSNDNPLLQHARGAGLIALDLFPPLRRFLARRMMFGARAW